MVGDPSSGASRLVYVNHIRSSQPRARWARSTRPSLSVLDGTLEEQFAALFQPNQLPAIGSTAAFDRKSQEPPPPLPARDTSYPRGG